MPSLVGIHHIALNVTNLERSVQWYGEVLGFEPLFPFATDEFDRRIMRHPSGAVIALTTHNHPDARAAFSERRTGLDHLSLGVDSEDELQKWVQHLDRVGVPHSDVKVTPATGSVLVAFRDQDNIQLELYVAQGATTK